MSKSTKSTRSQKKTADKVTGGSAPQALLLSCQQAAKHLGLPKSGVHALVDEGLLKEVYVNGKPFVTARSIGHLLGYDPYGVMAVSGSSGGKYTNLTFEKYAVKTLNKGVKQAHSRAIENYRVVLSIAAKELGKLRMTDISEEDLRLAFRHLESQYAKSTLEHVAVITRMMFHIAYDAGDIPVDPTAKWKAGKSKKPQKEKKERVYTEEEVKAILETSRFFNQELYTMFALLNSTGMRPGEMLALEWERFDEEAKTIRVYQAVTREFSTIKDLSKAGKSKSVISVPKTEYSVRTLLLTDIAVEALKSWRKALRKNSDRRKARSKYIFPGKKGGFRSLSGAENMLQKYRKACNMTDVTFYKFRHTMCTRLTLEHYPVSIIQRVLGDNSPDVITRVYTHIGNDDALKAMAEYFSAAI